MGKIETRTFRGTALRASQSGDMSIDGRALSYNTPSGNLGGFKEVLSPGCFSRSLASGSDVLCRREHETGFLLGRTKNGSLTLQDGPSGLDFICKIDPADPIAVSTRAAIQSGLIDSMSFAFNVDGADGDSFSSPDANGLLTRTIKRAILVDVAPVCAPAYPTGTSVSARAADYVAARPQSDQTVIRAQIKTFEARRKQRIADARAAFSTVPGAPLEEIARWRKLGYSIDVQNELRAAEISKTISRQGYTGADFSGGYAGNSPRFTPGDQTSDPTQSLRDDDFDFDDDNSWDKSEHERAAEYHRALARKSSTMERGIAHFKAADLHQKAADTRLYPYSNSTDARVASKVLTLADVS